MCVCQRSRAVDALCRQCSLDRSVLPLVVCVELVDRLVSRCPDRRPGERPSGALCHLLDERRIGDAVDHIVESVIRAHPLRRQRTSVAPRFACADRAAHSRKALLRLFELGEVGLRDLRRREAGRKRLQLGAHEERLPHALPRQCPHADPAIRLELDEPEGGEPPKRLADRSAADAVLLRELVLA